jgi:L-threonylcarbamoyladenylate synthase
VARAAEALRGGLIVAIPTDTVYGLAASIRSVAAIARLYSLKGRPRDKAIPVLLSEASGVELVARGLPPVASILASEFWPGALTLVLPALSGLPDDLTAAGMTGENTVGVRVPDHPLARAIIAAAGGALAVTSANSSGGAPALEASEAVLLQHGGPDLVIDGGRAPGGVASTVVDVSEGPLRVLREGAISRRTIEEALRGDHPARSHDAVHTSTQDDQTHVIQTDAASADKRF